MDRSGSTNLLVGVIMSVLAAVVGAAIWAAVSVITNYQIGWMAVGVGFLVGYAMRYFGKGSAPVFGVTSSVIALLGCSAGNVLTVLILVEQQEKIGMMPLLYGLTPGIVMELLQHTFQPMDLLFYAIAVYEAYKVSLKPAQEAPAVAQQAALG